MIRRRRPRALVLLYHRVARLDGGDPYGQAVTPETFERHLRHLHRTYRVVSIETVLQERTDGSESDGTVAVTFDDGYVDNATQAYPLAAAHAVPLTIFVTVQPVLDRTAFWWDELVRRLPEHPGGRDHSRLHARLRRLREDERRRELDALGPPASPDPGTRPLTVGELQELAARPGVGIGAHTLTHPVLSSLPLPEQRRELVDSRRRLEDLVGRPVELLAYPFGKRRDISRETVRLASECGYRAAFTSAAASITASSNPYALGRLSVHEWPEAEFARRLAAWFA